MVTDSEIDAALRMLEAGIAEMPAEIIGIDPVTSEEISITIAPVSISAPFKEGDIVVMKKGVTTYSSNCSTGWGEIFEQFDGDDDLHYKAIGIISSVRTERLDIAWFALSDLEEQVYRGWVYEINDYLIEHLNLFSIPDEHLAIIQSHTELKENPSIIKAVPDLKQKFAKELSEREEALSKFKDSVIPVISDHVGEDNVIVTEEAVYIIYSEVIIKNSRGQRHLIRDLAVKLNVRYDKTKNKFWFTGTVEGARFTYTEEEVLNMYRHSHLPGNRGIHFSNFCLGGGSGFSVSLSDLSFKVDDLDYLDIFMYELESYVSWESLEGGPYKQMQHIGGGNSWPAIPNTLVDGIYSTLKDRIKLDDFVDIVLEGDSIACTYASVESKLMKMKLAKQYLCIKRGEDDYVMGAHRLTEQSKADFIKEAGKIKLGDREITMKIVQADIDDSNVIYPVPNLTEKILELLNKDLNEYYFNT